MVGEDLAQADREELEETLVQVLNCARNRHRLSSLHWQPVYRIIHICSTTLTMVIHMPPTPTSMPTIIMPS